MKKNVKRILISGGSDGLGKAIAERLSKNNTVIILSNDVKQGESAAKSIGCDFVSADISDYSQVKTAVENAIKKHGSIDCLINNAGIYLAGQLDEHDPNHIKRLIEVNVVGTMYLTHAVIPYMKKKKSGHIINVVSQNGLMHKADRSVYTASKWAMTGFTKCLSEDLLKSNIIVSGFYPGLMKTKLFQKVGAARDISRSMDPKDAARAIEFIVDTPRDLNVSELGIKPSWS
jgi:3-oxoacyl-[acyl-carrier protein] reductase